MKINSPFKFFNQGFFAQQIGFDLCNDTKVVREKLTPEQVEQEKQEFEANRLNRYRNEIKHMVEGCLEVGCMKRDNLKPHYITKVYFLEDLHKVVADCAFCGIADYYYSSESAETLSPWLDEEFNK